MDLFSPISVFPDFGGKITYFPLQRLLERTLWFSRLKGWRIVLVFFTLKENVGEPLFWRDFGAQKFRFGISVLIADPGRKKVNMFPFPKKRGPCCFSRFSTAGSCRLHGDGTELQNWVPGVLNKRENKSKKLRQARWLSPDAGNDSAGNRVAPEWNWIFSTALSYASTRSLTDDRNV